MRAVKDILIGFAFDIVYVGHFLFFLSFLVSIHFAVID